MEAQGCLSMSNEFRDLPEALITRILCFSAPKYISSTSKTCKYLNKLLNSAEFLKAYQDSRHKSGCIITDNFGSECPEPQLYIYDVISRQWNTIAVAKLCPSMLNPQMVSASGGLVLFLANKRRSSDYGQMKEVVVLQLFTKHTIKLPNPPLDLSSAIANTIAMEIVVDTMGSSYKVFLYAHISAMFWVYDSCIPAWKRVILSDMPPPRPNRIVSRSVSYRGVLHWLIDHYEGACCLIFYDTHCDALRRPTICFSRDDRSRLCGIAVCGGKIIGVFKERGRESKLLVSQLDEENGDCWKPLFECSVPNMGSDVFFRTGLGMTVCSNGEEDENVFWMLCLISKEKEIYGYKMLERNAWLLACNWRDEKWQQLNSPSTGECDDTYQSGVTDGISDRPLSQAKWMNFKFTGAI